MTLPSASKSIPHPSLIRAGQWLALVAGLFATALALWNFYYRPWLGLTSSLDPWLDRHKCLVETWCISQILPQDKLAGLAVVTAILLFAAVLWPAKASWRQDVSPIISAWLPQNTRVPLAVLGLLGLGFTAAQAYSLLVKDTVPTLYLWLPGIFCLVSAALLVDMNQPAELQRTGGQIAVGVGIGLIVIGVAPLLVGRWEVAWLALLGLILFGIGSRSAVRAGSSLRTLDHLFMLLLALVALGLALRRVWSWEYAFIGDEWGFYEFARTLIHEPELFKHRLFDTHDGNHYFTVFSSALQALVMLVAGEDIFGWRLSALLPMVLATPAVYAFCHWLADREAAFLGTALFAGSHVLLSFSLVAYNNTQTLLIVCAALAAFAFARAGQSMLRYLLVGMILGIGFIAYGLARLAIVPLGLLFLINIGPNLRQLLSIGSVVAVGWVAAAAPTLFNLYHWAGLLKATPVESEVAERLSNSVLMTRNLVAGLLVFIANTNIRNSHFVWGPHTDPLTALLMMMGMGAAIAGFWRIPRARSWLVAGLLLIIIVSAIQQYEALSVTRVFILPTVYAVFAGVGGAGIMRWLLGDLHWLRAIILGWLASSAILLNQYHIERISLVKHDYTSETYIIQQLQMTAAADKGGMRTLIVVDDPIGSKIGLIAQAYGISRERTVLVQATELEDHLTSAVCTNDGPAIMVLAPASQPTMDTLRHQLTTCWPDVQEAPILDNYNRVRLLRFFNQAGIKEVAKTAAQRASARRQPDLMSVARPGDMAVAANGDLFVLSLDRVRIFQFTAEGQPKTSFPLVQKLPTAMHMTPNGLLVVADADEIDQLVWYNSTGDVVQRAAPAFENGGVIRGIDITPNGEIFAADTELSRVIQLTANGEVIRYWTAEGRIQHPGTVAVAADGTLWVHNATEAQILHISPADRVLAAFPTAPGSPEQGARLLALANGDLLMSQPHFHRLVRLQPSGKMITISVLFRYPTTLSIGADNRLYVADTLYDEVVVLPLE